MATVQRRRRLDVASAREMILDAAERAFELGGVEAVRVQSVARAIGVTDAAIHHHFGNREGLLKALLRRVGRKLRKQLSALVAEIEEDALDLDALSRLFLLWYAERGYARLAMWLVLSGFVDEERDMLAELVAIVHRARVLGAERTRLARPALRDTREIVAWFHSAMMAEALFGGAARRSAGLADDAASERRFRHMVLTTFEALILTGPKRRSRETAGRRR